VGAFGAASLNHFSHGLDGGVVTPTDAEDVKPIASGFGSQCGYR
jgi:hypothetical protein